MNPRARRDSTAWLIASGESAWTSLYEPIETRRSWTLVSARVECNMGYGRDDNHTPQSNDKLVAFQHSQVESKVLVLQVANFDSWLSRAAMKSTSSSSSGSTGSTFSCIVDLRKRSVASLHTDSLNGNRSFVLRSSRSHLAILNMEDSTETRESIVHLAIRLLQREVDEGRKVIGRRPGRSRSCS